MKNLETLTPEERVEVQRAWVRRLDTRPSLERATRRLRTPDGRMCAFGELADELVTRGYGQWEDRRFGQTLCVLDSWGEPRRGDETLPPVVFTALDLPPSLTDRMTMWNDHGVDWPDIAREVRRTLGL